VTLRDGRYGTVACEDGRYAVGKRGARTEETCTARVSGRSSISRGSCAATMDRR